MKTFGRPSFVIAAVLALSAVVVRAQVAGPTPSRNPSAPLSAAEIDKVANWPAPLYWQPPAPSGQADSSGRIVPGEEKPRTIGPQLGVATVFVAITPCRLVDTRNDGLFPDPSTFGGPSMGAGTTRVFPVPSGSCGLPATAAAYSFNIAVVPVGSQMRWLTAWPDGETMPTLATLNDKAGLVTSNAAIVAAGNSGAVDIYVEDATDVIMDVNGYYTSPAALALGAGTAAAPALTFSNDTNSGLYSPSAGTVNVTSGGTNVLTVNSGGASVTGNLGFSGAITQAGTALLRSSTSNGSLFLGVGANGSLTPANNTAVGHNALHQLSGGNSNTAVGDSALYSVTGGIGNVAVGPFALMSNTNNENTAVGAGALESNQSGTQSTAVGAFALQQNTASGSTAVGDNALAKNTSGTDNTALGYYALAASTTSFNNTAVGYNALSIFNPTAGTGGNTAVGMTALAGDTSGFGNTAVGAGAGAALTSGSANDFFGSSAGPGQVTGSTNVGIGNSSLYSLTSGGGNIAIGYQAGYNIGSGSNNIDIGNEGVASDSGVIRIGTSQWPTYIAGIYNIVPGGTLQSVVVNPNGALGVQTSSRRFKQDIRELGDTTETLMTLRPVRFRYKVNAPDGPENYGLIAEEVNEVAPELVGRGQDGQIDSVFYDKVNAMLLNEVQKQHRQIEALESRLAEIESRVK